ncbi:hypothetical protein [Actinomadura craniellae]|uniref:hypothetical protein n=1 Tax=Actinomadura craniellae TaxID=2231787 RepID=UPI0018F1E052|nr:hypothetical protein [Actinomadura craniellae]
MERTRARLTIGELRQACNILLTEAERLYGADFDLADAEYDYYWNLQLDAIFDLTEKDQDSRIDCGQISDDAAEIAALLRRDDLIALWHDLEHAVGLLRLLAYMDLPGGVQNPVFPDAPSGGPHSDGALHAGRPGPSPMARRQLRSD